MNVKLKTALTNILEHAMEVELPEYNSAYLPPHNVLELNVGDMLDAREYLIELLNKINRTITTTYVPELDKTIVEITTFDATYHTFWYGDEPLIDEEFVSSVLNGNIKSLKLDDPN